ncbi:MAG: PEP/pyruvate-binding domain-containing protein [Desulfobacteraceae bacterium]|jgi:pyruvate,water dikinase
MNLIISLEKIGESKRPRVGGKSFALARMREGGLNVPRAVCITTDAYDQYVDSTGLRERLLLELHRKKFEEMRWEEIWDAALRIRNMFLTTPMPPKLHGSLKESLESIFAHQSVVVRSSAPGEDSAKTSFAGLHESYVHIRGADRILEYVQKVWASLWSDAALLYRQELGLDFERSSMAVVVQEIVVGERSGVIFGRNPNDPSQSVIESVFGLNQGLVDGTVEPDRWLLDRETGRIINYVAGRHDKFMAPSEEGVRLRTQDPEKSKRAPLSEDDVARVYAMALRTENLFGAPQDMEWTFRGEVLYALQARPITTLSRRTSEDQRSWYLSLRRNFENLKALRRKIEEELIPAMKEEGSRLALQDLAGLSDRDLADEIGRRGSVHADWVKVYWRDFIPFAHGARLFGQVYNDVIHPSDPYEFMDLLADTGMVSIARNRSLEEMATMVRGDPKLEAALGEKHFSALDKGFIEKLDTFVEHFEDLSCGTDQCFQGRDAIIEIVLELASRPSERTRPKKNTPSLRRGFLARFQGEERAQAEELLDLARTSYRLRDDDNIYLGKIKGQLLAAIEEGKRRLAHRSAADVGDISPEEVIEALRDPSYMFKSRPSQEEEREREKQGFSIKPRQLVGQPAGQGLSRGIARVILDPADLLTFKAGEILICDAVDPNMTFVVPLASGIVERRGGMLIHGAIIAREYGLPCVTGIPNATSLIRTGDLVTVDGYLGIVIIG